MRAVRVGLVAAASVMLAVGPGQGRTARPICVTVQWTRDPLALQVIGIFTGDSVPATLARRRELAYADRVDTSPTFARALAVTSLAGYDSARIEGLVRRSGSYRIFLVPYGVADDCTRFPDQGDPRREYPGALFAALRLRPPAEWIAGAPTADFGPFEIAHQEALDSLWRRWRPDSVPPLTVDQFAVVFRALPTSSQLACSPRAALDSLRALLRGNPDWRRRRPLPDILSWAGWANPEYFVHRPDVCPDTLVAKRPNERMQSTERARPAVWLADCGVRPTLAANRLPRSAPGRIRLARSAIDSQSR
jgi:hypothetical protein